MIVTKIKRFISILLCVIVLLSFSLSAFASYSTLVYENINSIQESFVASFLSHCGIEVEFFDFDIDYSGSEFKNAAWCNLTREFLNYVDNNDSKLTTKILEYASSSGVDSSIQSSTYVWTGSFKDCRSIVNQLIYHFYNFLTNYENVYGYCDVPIFMYVGIDDPVKYTGVYSRVTFLNIGSNVDTWYNNVGKSIQDYCTGDYVDDDFAECYLNYYWDYGKLPLGYGTYLETLESYIDDYDTPSGDSSGGSSDSSDTSSSGSNSDSSEDTSSDENSYTSINSYYEHFYRSLFYCVLSSYDVHIFSSEYVNTEYVLDSAMDLIWKKIKNHEFSSYSTALTDFKNIANYEYDNFVDSDIKFYQIDFSATEFHKRFYYGFYDIFFSVFDVDGDDAYGTSEFLGCKCVDFDGMTLVFSFDTSMPLGQGSQFSSQWNEKLYNFIRTYNGPLYIPFYKDSSLYFMDYTWNHPTYGWSKTFKIFDGYSMILYHENQPEDSIEYWYYDKNAIYETWTDWLNKYVPAVEIPSALQALDNFFNYPVEFINHFFLYTSDFFAFLGLLWDMIPNEFTIIMLSGFIIIFVTKLFTRS